LKYSDIISITSNFQRSTNIVFDTNCDSYILSTSSIQALRRILVTNTSNSIAITGPFGSGKSSLLIYLESLLIKDKESQVCIEKLAEKDLEIYSEYKKFVGEQQKGFYSIKMVGEHLSFKKIFIDTLLKHPELIATHQFIETNKDISFTLLLKQLNKEINKLGYAGLLILIDELGKTIEYASEKYLDSDIHALQDLAEYVNNQSNIRLVVALHKSFKGYVHNTTHLSFTEWDKIQGRFDSIIFQDDFYELMHIFEQAISVDSNELMKNVTEKIGYIYSEYKNHAIGKHIPVDDLSLVKLAPLHPFTSLALFHIFSKYFQNQRSVFSFLSAQEPFSFQSFLNQESNQESNQETLENTLFTLDMLFDYINYLSNAYAVNMVDKESWGLANEYLDSANILTSVQKKIIKSIALISAFGLENLIQLDKKTLALTLVDSMNIDKEIEDLESKGLILFKRVTNAYALIEELSINIDEELTHIIKNQIKVDYKKEINKFFENDRILAKRFVIETGTAKFFTKEFIDVEIGKSINLIFKLIYVSSDISEKEIIDASRQNINSIYFWLPLSNQVKSLIQQSLAINTLLGKKHILSKQRICRLLLGMLNANKNEIDKILDIKEIMYFHGEAISYSSEKLQQKISSILQIIYPEMPVIINDLVNPIQKETNVPIGLKQLFEQMINSEHEKNLAIEKLPAHMAIYLSVIKRAGFHKEISGQWLFSEPTEDNFSAIWQELFKLTKTQQTITVDSLIDKLCLEPYGLNDYTAKFVVFLFLIINESSIHFFRERTYQFDYDIDQLMDIWKNSKLYTIRWYELSKDEELIFAKYISIFDQFIETDFTKKNIKTIFQKLYMNLNALPKYCHQTKSLSDKAISLRSGILVSKEPHTIFFKIFPNALGYKELNAKNIEHFISEFKDIFNEIVFSYKNMLQELELHVAEAFELSSKHYPFENELEAIFEKYLEGHDDKQVNSINRVCTTAIDIRSFLNGVSLVLNNKKVDIAFDHDIKDLKHNISIFANRLLSNIDIVDLINKRPVDVKKLKISTLNGDNNLVMMVDKEKISQLGKKADDMLKSFEPNLTKDEKLYLITMMAEKTLQDNN
jgi:energy-coupling factor transporter ATP-binding protein EcfA2